MIISPEDFSRWLADLKAAGIAATAREAAPLLAVSENTMSTMRRKGVSGDATHRTALAMSAVLAGLKPYGGDDGGKTDDTAEHARAHP
jgi:hypothetical protein